MNRRLLSVVETTISVVLFLAALILAWYFIMIASAMIFVNPNPGVHGVWHDRMRISLYPLGAFLLAIASRLLYRHSILGWYVGVLSVFVIAVIFFAFG